VVARSGTGQGVTTFSDNDIAVFAQAGTFAGVFNGAFVVNKGPGRKDGAHDAVADPINGCIVLNDGHVIVQNGNVQLKKTSSITIENGDLTLGGADCAEEFDISDGEIAEPGTVMVLDDRGALRPSERAYDTRVAGVVSGAGSFKPAVVLDRRADGGTRAPIALMGKAFCKVDANHSPVAVGDMLTTAPTPGHAMKADDPGKAFGAVIGKALAALTSGQGVIPVLIALQ
jgi:hypothetical protein